MYTFSREHKTNAKTGEKFHVDHFEMKTGERNLLSNGVLNEHVKAGHVEPAMLADKDFAAAYAAFVESQKPKVKIVKGEDKHEK